MRPAFSRRLAGVEGLRGLAAAAVVVNHVWANATPGHRFSGLGFLGPYVFAHLGEGVTLFFALSGFLLYLPFARAAIDRRARPSFGAYLRNRALRILPAYWVILTLTSYVFDSVSVHGRVQSLSGSLFLRDALLIQNYDHSSLSTGIGPAWSLAVEIVFYLVLPGLVVCGMWLGRRHPVAGMVAAPLFLVPLGLAGTAWAHHVNSEMLNVSFIGRAHLFVVGMLVAVARVQWENGKLKLPPWWRPLGWSALVLITVTTVITGARGSLPPSGEVVGISIASGLLLALVALGGRRSTVALDARPLAFAGLISYSVYLWHEPLLQFIRAHGWLVSGGPGAFLFDLLLISLATGIAASLTYLLVEHPALKLKSGRRTTALSAAPTIVEDIKGSLAT